MTRDDGPHSLGDSIQRQVLENIPEDPAVDYLELRRKIPFSIKAHSAAIDPRRRDGGLPGWPGRPPQDSPNGLGRSDAPGRPLWSSGTGWGGRRSVVRIME